MELILLSRKFSEKFQFLEKKEKVHHSSFKKPRKLSETDSPLLVSSPCLKFNLIFYLQRRGADERMVAIIGALQSLSEFKFNFEPNNKM